MSRERKRKKESRARVLRLSRATAVASRRWRCKHGRPQLSQLVNRLYGYKGIICSLPDCLSACCGTGLMMFAV